MIELADLEAFGSFEAAVLDGFARRAADWPDAKVRLTYDPDPDHVYDDDQIGIYMDTAPELRTTTVTLAEYSVSDDPSLSDSVVGIQVSIWSPDRDTIKSISSDLFNQFHGLWSTKLGVVSLVSCERSSGTNVGQDSQERPGRTENYYATVHRPSPNRN